MEEIRILLLEDSAADAELVQVELQIGGIQGDLRRVADQRQYLQLLREFKPDVILADYNIPGFSGMVALMIRNEQARQTPFIFVTGSLGEELAVATLRAGATDFVLKDRMARLPNAVKRALEDIRLKKEQEWTSAELKAERSLMQAILATARALVVVLDDEGRILHANPAAERVLQWPRERMRDEFFWNVVAAGDMVDPARRHVIDALIKEDADAGSWAIESPAARIVVWSAGRLPTEGNRSERLVMCGIDVTEQEKAEERAYVLAHFDAVTGLPNRKLFAQQLEHYRDSRETQTGSLLVVMMVGIARLRQIADSYGEAASNEVLLTLVQRLRVWQIHAELLARITENSFALAFEVSDLHDLELLVPRILHQLREPVPVHGRQWPLAPNAGIALHPHDAASGTELLQAAESALHRAEAKGGSSYAFYSSELSVQTRDKLALESELREALQSGDGLVLYYQPQVRLDDGRVIGAEGLVRWRHPRLGMLSPDRFIPLAEECGLISELGQWVINTACAQMAEWARQELQLTSIAVNLSATEFAADDLPDRIARALSSTGVSARQIEIELTESASMRDPHASVGIIRELREMGLRISIDDFGTGYSNLSYLKRFRVDCLKLDRAFVTDIVQDPDALAIARAVIAMAHQLRLQPIAEGVETREQLALLREAGCNVIQGYLFSPAVPAEACAELIRRGFPVEPDSAV